MRLISFVFIGSFTIASAAPAIAGLTYTNASAYARSSYSIQSVSADFDEVLDEATPPIEPADLAADGAVGFDGSGFSVSGDSSASVQVGGPVINGATSVMNQWSAPQGQTVSMSSRGEVVVEFSLSEDTPFVLDALWSTDGPPIAGITLRITEAGSGASVYFFGGTQDPSDNPFHDTGLLTAGDYVLTQETVHSGANFTGNGSRTSSLDFTLTIPSPASAVPLAGLTACFVGRRRR